MKKWLNYLPTIFIITIVMSLIFYSSQGTTEQMNYSRFKDVAEHAEFEDSTLTISTTIIQVEGSYKTEGKDAISGFRVIVPNTEANLEWLETTLTEDGGRLTIADPNQNSVWINLLVNLIPFLIIGVFFYLMFSKLAHLNRKRKPVQEPHSCLVISALFVGISLSAHRARILQVFL